MAQGFRFPYSSLSNDPSTRMPRLPLTLKLGSRTAEVTGLVDSGASVSVLPYSVGINLGAVWEDQPVVVPLVGSLGRFEAKVLIVQCLHPQLTPNSPIELVFAWTQDENAPVLFGQTNFLMEFRVCFDAQLASFEVYLKDR